MAASKIKELESRLAKVERAVFPKPRGTKSRAMDGKYDGLTGGVQLLIDGGFFKQPVIVTQVQEELEREGYFWPIESTIVVLGKFVNEKKILKSLKDRDVWRYVLRK